jgi:hypothetical protein
MEENTSHFQIERMNSTTGEVEIIGFVEAAGVSFDILNYSFPDLNLPSGEVRILYRLVTRDFDGHQEESNWVSVNLQNDLSIDFYPNPVQNTLTVDLDPTFASEQTIRILDMQGRVLNELSTTSDQVTVDMTGLKPGMYIITVGTNNNYKSEKFYVK